MCHRLLFAEINLKFQSDVIIYLFTFIFESERCGLAVCVCDEQDTLEHKDWKLHLFNAVYG